MFAGFEPGVFGSESSNLEYSILSAILGSAGASLDVDGSLSLDSMDAISLDLNRTSDSPIFSGMDSRMSPEPYAMGLLGGSLGARPGLPGSIGEPLEGSPEPYMQGLHDAVFSPLDPLPPMDLAMGLEALSQGISTGEDDLCDLEGIVGYKASFSRAESPIMAVTPGETMSLVNSPKRGKGKGRAKTISGSAAAASALARSRLSTPPQTLPPPPFARTNSTAILDPIAAVLASPNAPHLSVSLHAADALGARTAPDVYARTTSAFDYTTGYHALMRHLHAKFSKPDLLRIVRALAVVRPSLIALQMPLCDADEVFVEKCFQRSLIEYEKLVSFSGTPTVAWRRTGEVVLVGPEFAMLTGWDRSEIVGGGRYIWELFDNSSVVEYWENFAQHAFENTTQSVVGSCTLLKPDGASVPCAFCFTIRKDIFDLPSLIIGESASWEDAMRMRLMVLVRAMAAAVMIYDLDHQRLTLLATWTYNKTNVSYDISSSCSAFSPHLYAFRLASPSTLCTLSRFRPLVLSSSNSYCGSGPRTSDLQSAIYPQDGRRPWDLGLGPNCFYICTLCASLLLSIDRAETCTYKKIQ
jgi:PAS domain-containing protein